MEEKTTSIRFCINCNKNTEWGLDKLKMHSVCRNCGIDSRYAKGEKPKDQEIQKKMIMIHRCKKAEIKGLTVKELKKRQRKGKMVDDILPDAKFKKFEDIRKESHWKINQDDRPIGQKWSYISAEKLLTDGKESFIIIAKKEERHRLVNALNERDYWIYIFKKRRSEGL